MILYFLNIIFQVKMLLEADTGIPPSEQVLSGWPKHSEKELEVQSTHSIHTLPGSPADSVY